MSPLLEQTQALIDSNELLNDVEKTFWHQSVESFSEEQLKIFIETYTADPESLRETTDVTKKMLKYALEGDREELEKLIRIE